MEHDMDGQNSKRELTTNKTETAKRYRPAREVEAEAEAKAQMLADATAAELEELARSMHSVTGTMCQVMERIAKSAQATSDNAKKAAASITHTAEEMRTTTLEWQRTAKELQRQLATAFRHKLTTAALSAAVGAVSASLLNHSWPASSSHETPPSPQIIIDTDRLSTDIITKWRQYQGASGSAR